LSALLLAGYDHKHSRLCCLEKAHIADAGLADFFDTVPFAEKVWIQTCNRRELAVMAGPGDAGKIAGFLSGRFGHEPGVYYGRAALRRLFLIASGVESSVPGETQVLGQIRDAYAKARRHNSCGPALGRVFEAAIRAARLARNLTGLSIGAVSIAQAAVELAWQKTGLSGKKVLIIGAGKVNETVARYAAKKGAALVMIANRTYERAARLASATGAKAVCFRGLRRLLPEADVVISSTSAPHTVIKKERYKTLLSARQKPLLMIDLAVPRDIDPGLAGGNTVVLNIDDINDRLRLNAEKRNKAAIAAVKIVEKEVEKYEYRSGNKGQPAGHGAGTGGHEEIARGNAGTAF